MILQAESGTGSHFERWKHWVYGKPLFGDLAAPLILRAWDHPLFYALLKDAGHGEHVFGPPIHGLGIEFEESPLPAGHAFFHGEKAPPPLPANVVLAIGNCGLYLGPWGVRVEDTVVVGHDGPQVLTSYPAQLGVRTI